MNSRDRIPFLIADCSGIIVLQLKKAETERTFIVHPSANKIRPFLLTENAIVRLGLRNAQKCAILVPIIGFATLGPAHLGEK